MTRKLIIAALCVAAAGCSTPNPHIEVRTVEVVKTVPVECVAASDIPARPEPLGEMPTDARDALNVALAKLLEWADPKSGYGTKAEAIMKGCSVPR